MPFLVRCRQDRGGGACPPGLGFGLGFGLCGHAQMVVGRAMAGNLAVPYVHILDSAMYAQPIDIAGYFLCRGDMSTLFTQQVSGFFIA